MATITQQDYFLKPGETPEQYNIRIANLRGDTQQNLQNIQNLTSTALAKQNLTPISSPIDVSRVSPTQQNIELPTPQAPSIQEQYTTSLTENLQKQRTQLESLYSSKIEELNKQIEESQKKISDFSTLQQGGVLKNVETLTQPFRQNLETTERQRLYIDENFQANQSLVNELDSLLTEGNELIKQQKETTGLASIRNPRIAQTIEDVSARAGVIQAVLNARNGQIAQAYNMIDRSVAAITADRQDRLNYYSTLFDFYENQKSVEGQKLLNLTKEQKSYVQSQISLLESDIKIAQKYADNIKEAMTDPDTAMAYARAGVKLTDSPEEIGKKLAEYSYVKEKADISNKMASDGYSYLVPGQSVPQGANVVTITDSKGKTKQYYKIGTKATTTQESGNTFGGVTLITPKTNQVLERGFSGTTLTPSERSKVETDLTNLGIYSGVPPQWFVEKTNNEAGQSLTSSVIKQVWDEYKKTILSEDKGSTQSSISDEEFLNLLRSQ